MLLAPFQEFALEVHFLISQFVDVNEATKYLLPYEAFTILISSVKIDGTYECFEGIACKVAVVRLIMFVATNELVETYLRCQSSERFALHDLASGIGEEAFSLAGKVVIDYLAYNGIEDGIAQELQPFVVEQGTALGVCVHRLVHQGFLIEAYLVRIEAQHIMKSAIKLLVLTERKPYRVYQVYGRHGLILRIS